jgi:hypothetical protein
MLVPAFLLGLAIGFGADRVWRIVTDLIDIYRHLEQRPEDNDE